MKVLKKLTAGMLSVLLMSIIPFTAMAFSVGPVQKTEIKGPVKEKTETTLTIDNQLPGGFSGDFIVYITEDQKIIERSSGAAVDYDAIREGDLISAVIGSAVTASIPPGASASTIYLEGETGWVLKSGKAGTDTAVWKHYDKEGQMSKGWLIDDGKWYYLDPESGVMQRGFILLEGKTYYLQKDGSMLTTPKLFTPDETGALTESF